METVDNYFQRGSEFLGTKYPIMGGAMTWVSESNLVSAISNAGGLGVLACGSMDAQKLRMLFDVNGIEHRPIIGGNLLKQPFLSDYSIVSNKSNLTVDFVHYNGVYLGNNQFIGKKEIDLLDNVLRQL